MQRAKERSDTTGRLIDADEVLRIARGEFSEEDLFKISWLVAHVATANENNGDLISRSALEKKVEGMYLDYRSKAQTPQPSGMILVNENLVYAATVAKAILDMIKGAPIA